MLKELIVQAIGMIGYSILSVSYFKKNKLLITLMQIIANIFLGIHHYLLNGITGSLCNLMCILALLIIYLFEKYNLRHKIFIVTILIILLLIIGIITFQNIYSIFPIIASTILIISFLKKEENSIRIMGGIVCICWLIYAIVYKSYAAIFFQVVTLVNIILSLISNPAVKKVSKLK